MAWWTGPTAAARTRGVDDDDIIDGTEERADGKLPLAARVRCSQDALKTSNDGLRLGPPSARRHRRTGERPARADGSGDGHAHVLRCARGVRCCAAPTKLLQPLAACRPGALVVHPRAHKLGRRRDLRQRADHGCRQLELQGAAHERQLARRPSPGGRADLVLAGHAGLGDARPAARQVDQGQLPLSYVGVHATVVKVQAARALVRWLAATPVSAAPRPSR